MPNTSLIGVYAITIGDRTYIGSSARDIKGRWRTHLWALRSGRHHSRFLQRAFDKYGEASVCFSVLELVDNPEDAVVVEQRYIDTIQPAFNVNPVAASTLGTTPSPETRLLLSASGKLAWQRRKEKGETHRPMSPEHRAKIAAAHLGKKRSPEQRAAMRGGHHAVSPEGRVRMGATHKGIPKSPEYRAKISAGVKAYLARQKPE